MQGMWVVHGIQALCLAQLTCYGSVWCVGCEELVEYVRYVWLWAVWVDEWKRGLGMGFTNPVGTEGVLDVCFCCGVGSGYGAWTRVSRGGVVLCLCEL